MLVMPIVTVVDARAGRSVVVEVRQLPRSQRDGFACLADVWRLARLPGALSSLAFDFVGADGFRSSKRSDARLGGAALGKGFVHRATCDLVWDEALELPCFFSVKKLSKLIAEPCLDDRAALPHAHAVGQRGGCCCDHARTRDAAPDVASHPDDFASSQAKTSTRA
jgi:hypothetical protein